MPIECTSPEFVASGFITSGWFWAMIQAFVVLGTLCLIYYQVRLQTATHVVQTLAAIHQRWHEESMLRARHLVCSRYLEGDTQFDSVSEYIAEFMEELGGYVKLHAVPVDVMWDAQSWYLEHYYAMFKNGISLVRQEYHDVTLYSNMQTLSDQMSRHSEKQKAPSATRGERDLCRFAKSEIQLADAFLKLHESRRPIQQAEHSGS